MIRQRDFPRPRHLATPDLPDIGEGMRRGAKGARRDDGGAVPSEAGAAMDGGGVDRCGQAH